MMDSSKFELLTKKKITLRRTFQVLIIAVVLIIVTIMVFMDTGQKINTALQSWQIKSNTNTLKSKSIKDELPWWENGDCLKGSNELNFHKSYNILKNHDQNQNEKFKQKLKSINNNYPEKINMTYLNESSTSGVYSKWKLGERVNNICGYRSWLRGPGQRIVSYCLYGNNKAYSKYLDDLMIRLKVAYKGWTVRLYTDPRGRKDYLCPLLKKHKHLDICDVKSLPPPLGDISGVHSAVWRFAPMEDPFVDVMISRDIDAKVLEREVSAVKQWLNGKATLHVMRDNPMHGVQILAGMWGVQISPDNRENLRKISRIMFMEGRKSQSHFHDQTVLARVLWPRLKEDMMNHDSYHCQKYYPYAIPWPTKRLAGRFVGNVEYRFSKHRLNKTCPIPCRPNNHKDWLYC